MELIERNFVILICCVCGNLRFVIEWSKEGLLLNLDFYYEIMLFGDLYIWEVCIVDYGKYRCCVINRVGGVVVLMRLIVIGKKYVVIVLLEFFFLFCCLFCLYFYIFVIGL